MEGWGKKGVKYVANVRITFLILCSFLFGLPITSADTEIKFAQVFFR